MLKIVVACAMGAGSSLMMEMKIEQVLSELGIKAKVTHTQISEAKSTYVKYDVIVTAINFLDNFNEAKNAGKIVIGIKNILSNKEIKEKFIELGLR